MGVFRSFCTIDRSSEHMYVRIIYISGCMNRRSRYSGIREGVLFGDFKVHSIDIME